MALRIGRVRGGGWRYGARLKIKDAASYLWRGPIWMVYPGSRGLRGRDCGRLNGDGGKRAGGEIGAKEIFWWGGGGDERDSKFRSASS